MADRGVGPGQVLLWMYGMFVVAAGARSAMQLALHPGRSPFAYTLSALAALAYVVGFVLVLRAERGADPRRAMIWCVVELAGVVVVGTLSVLVPSAFPDDTVVGIRPRLWLGAARAAGAGAVVAARAQFT
jgi:hypothetical protein